MGLILKKGGNKKALLQRIDGIEEHSRNLYRYLKSFVTIIGTEKDDWFVITRLPDGKSSIKGYRIKDGVKSIIFWDAEYDSKITKQIWIYGLDDKDVFEVKGDGKSLIPIKIIGGKNNDTYRFTNTRKVHVYDQRSKPNTFETRANKTLIDNYEINNYDFTKGRKDLYAAIPSLSYNPDDGVALGAIFSCTKNDIVRNPFTAQHTVSAHYYTATGGVNIQYAGEFAHVIRNLNLGINAGYTTPNYTNNFFGFGNDTANNTDDMEYNRVRMRQRWIAPSLIYKGYYGSRLQATVKYENIEIEDTTGRFTNSTTIDPTLFHGQDFYSIQLGYSYSNFDASSSPKKGLGFWVITGYKTNFAKDKGYAFITPEFRLTTKIDRKGTLVVATNMKANYIFNNDFEFYQAVTLGGNEGLRGFRTERFSGKSSYYQSTDLRLSLGRVKNGILPLSFGVYGGFDYGRVWIDNETSNKWHTSQGGGLFLNIAGLTTANIAYFNSTDGGRLDIKLDFAF
ncbi:ShlB/FhaC/HecB family hemolysin secretion/activation protein [Chryseobacterium wanjuense]